MFQDTSFYQWLNFANFSNPEKDGFWLLLLGMAGLILLLFLGVGRIRRYRISRLLSGDFPKDWIARAIKRYHPLYARGHTNHLVAILLAKLRIKDNPEYRQYLILGTAAAGKTTLLIRLYYRYRIRLGKKPWRMELVSMSSPDALLRIAKTPKREEVVLLIDGLEDDPVFNDFPKRRLDEIIESTKGFAKLVITCDENLWPGSKELIAKGEALRYVGEETSALFAFYELLKPNGKAKEPARPLDLYWLASIQSPAGTNRNLGLDHLPSEQMSRLLGRAGESPPAQLPELQVRQFWWKLAKAMQLRARQGMGMNVPAFQLEELRGRFTPDWDVKRLSGNLLWQDKVGRYRFVHTNIAAYFRADGQYQEKAIPDHNTWRHIPKGAYYYQSMQWARILRSQQGQDWYFRTELDRERQSLASLKGSNVLLITRLYLPAEAITLPPTFLPQMQALKGLYLEGVNRTNLPVEWLEALPHPEVQIYFTKNQVVQKVYRFQTLEGEIDQPHLPEIKLQATDLSLVDLREQPSPLAPIYNPRGHHRGDKSLLNLFHLDPKSWLAKEEAQLGLGWVIDEPLSVAEWGLFNRFRAFKLKDGSVNLLFEQTIMSTLISQEVGQVVKMLLAALGPDDDHLGPFGPDDQGQLEDGHWMGRKWLWKVNDRYAYPVHLFADKPGLANLYVWGVELT
ncbi:MAG: hypothetical protein AAF804_08090 [Bacteroidota bacterium]